VAFALRDARHVLVTGAAGAIGAALAERLARAAPGARLTLVDRARERVTVLATRLGAAAATWDLSRTETLEEAWVEATAPEPVDVLVNCAGIMEMRTFAGTPWSLGRDLIAIDLVSPLRLMALAVPDMLRRGAGIIINVASMAGLLPLRGASYYGAAKAGLAMASEIARLELGPRGVHVVTVYPGPVTSGLERRARGQLRDSWLSRALPTGQAAPLADRIVEAAEGGRPRVIYPSLYGIASRALGVSRRVTETWSPAPRA
jgi:short-subunit dehydrogenase